jgi:hypothetical protein
MTNSRDFDTQKCGCCDHTVDMATVFVTRSAEVFCPNCRQDLAGALADVIRIARIRGSDPDAIIECLHEYERSTREGRPL